MAISDKIKTLGEIIKIAKRLKKENKKIVTTNGVFDILHLGHVKYLEEAKRLGDILIVGINSDSSVKQFKSDKRPINNEKSRMGVLAGLESVDYIFTFREPDPRSWLSKIKPNVHSKGGDYSPSEILEKGIVENNGGKIVIAKMEKEYSTTKVISRILSVYRNQ
ncbi:D-glycero-beta-D-manno-heptose 1-phosphate adenylyltransferase [Candidatus Woesearchaeota archaeon]|nr:D-glycero-beta-D-manno-heptose 1-phosphate adenylyltransferase [Candidatus Woesearchaeota archaeon]